MTPPPIFYVLQILVPASLIVAGWVVVFNNAKKIEARKEARDFCQNLVEFVDRLSLNVIDYYKHNDQHIGPKSSKIKADFLLLSHYLFLLEGLGIKFKGSSTLNEFRKSSTGGYFETRSFKKQCEIPGWDAEIAALSAKMKIAIYRDYFEWAGNYKAPKPKVQVPQLA